MSPAEALEVLEAAGLITRTASHGERAEFSLEPLGELLEPRQPSKLRASADNRPSWAYEAEYPNTPKLRVIK